MVFDMPGTFGSRFEYGNCNVLIRILRSFPLILWEVIKSGFGCSDGDSLIFSTGSAFFIDRFQNMRGSVMMCWSFELNGDCNC